MTIMKSDVLSRLTEEKALPVTLADIEQAAARIVGQVARTPLIRSARSVNAPVSLSISSLKHLQPTGAFKLRGAMNAILLLDDAARKRGLVTASTGNHGAPSPTPHASLAFRAIICMSSLVPANKVEAIRSLGAEIRIVGLSQDDAQEEVERLTESRGPHADPAVRPCGRRCRSRHDRPRNVWKTCLNLRPCLFLFSGGDWLVALRLPSRP